MGKPERIYPPDMPARQLPKRESKMRQIVRQLQDTPNVQIMCKRTGVSRPTYYRWRANDFVFARAADYALEAGRFLVNDVIEAGLIQKVKDGDGPSQRYWLSHNHPRYSRREIPEHSHIVETKSTEEKQREEIREKRIDHSVIYREMREKLAGDIYDRHERKAYSIEDEMFERFEMLGDEAEADEAAETTDPIQPEK